jgi:hypothetical protein
VKKTLPLSACDEARSVEVSGNPWQEKDDVTQQFRKSSKQSSVNSLGFNLFNAFALKHIAACATFY